MPPVPVGPGPLRRRMRNSVFRLMAKRVKSGSRVVRIVSALGSAWGGGVEVVMHPGPVRRTLNGAFEKGASIHNTSRK